MIGIFLCMVFAIVQRIGDTHKYYDVTEPLRVASATNPTDATNYIKQLDYKGPFAQLRNPFQVGQTAHHVTWYVQQGADLLLGHYIDSNIKDVRRTILINTKWGAADLAAKLTYFYDFYTSVRAAQEGVKALASGQKTLDLRNKGIDDDGALLLSQALSQKIEDNSTMPDITIKLDGNYISAKGQESLSAAYAAALGKSDNTFTMTGLDTQFQKPDLTKIHTAPMVQSPNTPIPAFQFKTDSNHVPIKHKNSIPYYKIFKPEGVVKKPVAAAAPPDKEREQNFSVTAPTTSLPKATTKDEAIQLLQRGATGLDLSNMTMTKKEVEDFIKETKEKKLTIYELTPPHDQKDAWGQLVDKKAGGMLLKLNVDWATYFDHIWIRAQLARNRVNNRILNTLILNRAISDIKNGEDRVDLSNQGLTDDDVDTLIAAINGPDAYSRNQNLKHLNLANNKITDRIGKSLELMLDVLKAARRDGGHLLSISLEGNPISLAQQQVIAIKAAELAAAL